MAYPVDPMRTRYWPEIFGEAGSVTTTSSGAEIADYSNYHDFIVQLVTLATVRESTGNGAIRVNSDFGDNLINSPTEARFMADKHEDIKVTGNKSMTLFGYYPSGGSAQALRYRYGLRVTKPTVYEKLIYGMSLTDEEKALDTKFEITKKIQAGILGGETTPKFTKIYEVAKAITATASTNVTIGSEIHPLAGHKVVLLALAVERHGTADQVYVSVSRDGEQVMKLDTYAFKNSTDVGGGGESLVELNFELPLYVVALDKLKVWFENSVDITTFKVRYVYGIAPLTIIEKLRWGIPLTEDETAISTAYDLIDSMKAGVL